MAEPQECPTPGCAGGVVFDEENLHDVCQGCGRVLDTSAELQGYEWGGVLVRAGDDGAAAGAAPTRTFKRREYVKAYSLCLHAGRAHTVTTDFGDAQAH